MSDPSLGQRLRQRKLVQRGLAYLAGAFVVFQTVEVLAEPWGISAGMQRVIHILLLVGFFVQLIIAWYHGEKGRQRISGPELLMLASLLLIAGASVSLLGGERDVSESLQPVSLSEWEIPSPSGHLFGDYAIAISPSGDRLAFVALDAGTPRLHVREFDSVRPRVIAGTDRASLPFFSPDGSSIGFFSDGQLKRVMVEGGNPIVLADAPGIPHGGSWGEDGNVYYAHEPGVLQVPAAGGPVTALMSAGKNNFRVQQYLHAGRALLIIGLDGLGVFTLEDRQWHLFMETTAVGQARAVRSGHLLFTQGGNLWAVAFDQRRLEISGSPFQVGRTFSTSSGGRSSQQFDLSLNGTLVYAATNPLRKMVWVDREGGSETLPIREEDFARPRISPNGEWLIVTIYGESSPEGGQGTLWLYDLVRGGRRRVATGFRATDAAWSPNSRELVFTAASPTSDWDLFIASVDSVSAPRRLLAAPEIQMSHSWGPNGEVIAYYELTPNAFRDLWTVTLDGVASPMLATGFNERSPMFSPDAKWIAYVSDATGRDEVYVREFPGPGRSLQVSDGGGQSPLWCGNGRELFYRQGESVYQVAVDASTEFRSSSPRVLFRGQFDIEPPPSGSVNYHIAPDCQRFIMIQSDPPRGIHVVLNWFQELLRAAQFPNR